MPGGHGEGLANGLLVSVSLQNGKMETPSVGQSLTTLLQETRIDKNALEGCKNAQFQHAVESHVPKNCPVGGIVRECQTSCLEVADPDPDIPNWQPPLDLQIEYLRLAGG